MLDSIFVSIPPALDEFALEGGRSAIPHQVISVNAVLKISAFADVD